MPTDMFSPEALKMLGSLGVAGVLAYLLMYIVKVTLPKMQDKFDAAMTKQQTTFDAAMTRQQTTFESTLERIIEQHAARDQAIFDAFLQERREAKE